MDFDEIKQAFFTDCAHNLILYSTPLESSPLARIMEQFGINNFFDADLSESEARTIGSGLCPVFILGSDWIVEENLSAVDALTHLLRRDVPEQLAYKACFYFVPPDLLDKIVDKFHAYLLRNRDILTATKGDNKSFYVDMHKLEVVTYAYYTLQPLPKVTFCLS